MFLFASGHEAWAHGAVIEPAAFTHADASRRRAGEASLIVWKAKVGGRLPGVVPTSQTKILVRVVWVDDLSRIHLSIRVPDGLEFTERRDQLGSKHLRQQVRT